MIVLRDSSDLARISNPAIRKLVALRFRQLQSPDEPDASISLTVARNCVFIVVEGRDAVSEIEQVAGFPITYGLFDDLPFGHPDFAPCFELLEEYRNEHIYEMVFIGNDDGAATAIFIPDEEGIDADLLALCRSFATQVCDPTVTST